MKSRKLQTGAELAKAVAQEQGLPPEPQVQKIPITEEFSAGGEKPSEKVQPEDWFEPEGELAVDVFQTDNDMVIQSAIAGVRPEDLDVSIENDVVTIRGVRKNPNENEQKEYFHEECFWGPFSRQVFLPEEVDIKRAEASMKQGILTLRIPKIERQNAKKIPVKKGVG